MSTLWKVAAAAALTAVLGGWFLGSVVADQPSLPGVGDPVMVVPSGGAGTSEAPTPSDVSTSPAEVRDDRQDTRRDAGDGDGDDTGRDDTGRDDTRRDDTRRDDREGGVRTVQSPPPMVVQPDGADDDDDDGGDGGDGDDGDDRGGDD